MDLIEYLKTKSDIKGFQKVKENLFLLEIDSTSYYFKRIDYLPEYLIQKELSDLNLDIFLKEVQLFHSNKPIEDIFDQNEIKENAENSEENYFYFSMEEIKGKSLKKILRHLSPEELDTILLILFWSLKISWDSLKFVHLDLHLENVIVKKLNEESSIILNTFDERIELKTSYIPIIIDFEKSITKRYPNPGCENKTVLHDLWKLFGSLSLYTKSEQSKVLLGYINTFMDTNTFLENKEKYVQQWFNILPYNF
jgi:hypothetical protein